MLLYGSSELAETLVRTKLLRRVRGGWRMPDYLAYNPSGQQVANEREAKNERQQRWRETKKRSGRDTTETQKTVSQYSELTPVENSGNVYTSNGVHGNAAGQNGSGRRHVDASTRASRDASRDDAPTPPRPAPKEAGRAGPAPGHARANGRASPSGSPVRAIVPWCGECDERTRMREDGDGRPSRCPDCHPLGAQVQEAT